MLLAWRNHVAAASIMAAAGNEIAALPAANAKAPPIGLPWRSPLSSAQADIAFAAAQEVGALALVGTNLTAAARVRLKLSNAAAGGGDQLDTGLVDPGLSDLYPDYFLALPAAVQAKFLRVYAEDASRPYLDIGLVFAGPVWQPSRNYVRGATIRALDATGVAESLTGAPLIDALPRRREAVFDFDFLTDSEAMEEALALERSQGRSRPLIVMLDPDGEPVRRSLYGTIARATPHIFEHGRRVRKRFVIEEAQHRAPVRGLVPAIFSGAAVSSPATVAAGFTMSSEDFAGAAQSQAAAVSSIIATAASADGTEITPGQGVIIDSALDAWAVTASGVITRNGVPDVNTQGVVLVLWYGGVIYQTVADGRWWKWDPPNGWFGWVQVPGDPRAPGAGTIYQTAGHRIIAPDGQPFYGVGANLFIPTLGTLVKYHSPQWWGFNLVRLNHYPSDAGFPSLESTEAQTDAAIDYLLGLGLIVIVDVGHYIGGSGHIAQIDYHVARIANKYKNEPRVWIEPYNEYGDLCTTGTGMATQWDMTKINAWIAQMRGHLQVIRDTGFPNPIVISSIAWGQDLLRGTNFQAPPDAWGDMASRSAVMTFGDQIRSGFDNILFSAHVYDGWENYLASTGVSFDLGDYIQAAIDTGTPIFFGEWAKHSGSTGTVNAMNDLLSASALLNPSRRMSHTTWHGNSQDLGGLVPADGRGNLENANSTPNPSNLSSQGALMRAHQLQYGLGFQA